MKPENLSTGQDKPGLQGAGALGLSCRAVGLSVVRAPSGDMLSSDLEDSGT